MKRFALVTSDRAVKRLRKAYTAQGTTWPRGVRVVPLPGNRAGNTMLVSVSMNTLMYMAAGTGGTIGVL